MHNGTIFYFGTQPRELQLASLHWAISCKLVLPLHSTARAASASFRSSAAHSCVFPSEAVELQALHCTAGRKLETGFRGLGLGLGQVNAHKMFYAS